MVTILIHHIPGSLGRRGLLSSLALGLLSGSSRLGGGGGLRLLGSLGRSLRGLGGGGGGLGGSGVSRDLSDSVLLLVLGLHVLGGGRVTLLVTAKESTEDRGALPAGRALALVLLGVSALLLGLLLGLGLGGLSGGGGSLSGGGALGSGGLLSGLGGFGLGLLVLSLVLLLLLLLDGGGEGSEGSLVLLRLGDGLGKLLGLGDPQLDLADPVVALGGAASLESVLVSLGGQDELVGALGGGLDGIVLNDMLAC